MDQSGKLVLHIGGVYGDKAAAMNTFIQNYLRLPQEIRSRLILENDDKNYTIQEVLSISDEIGAPVVFDNLHHQVNASEETLTEPEWISKCGRTWKTEDGRQKLHYSQQKAGAMPGSHSDTVSIGPFLEFYQELKREDVDIMLEVKDKNLSALKCINTAVLGGNTSVLYSEWNRYQHFILSRSKDLYQEINILLETEIVNRTIKFYDRIEKALTLPDNPSDEVKAANHVWEYFSKDSTLMERNRYEKLISAYGNGTGSIQPVKNHLFKCAKVRDWDELMNSLYFYL
jgi:UV DNA damage endonuclease